MGEIVETNIALEKNLKLIENEEYISIDTEFIRENTYFSKLCLIQVASKNHSFIIDPLKKDINLDPFRKILKKNSIIKIFHSGRQDLEIFYHLFGELPKPIYDTQIAAMVCGFGDQVSYENLVNTLLNIRIDKSSRVSNWSFRPLTEKQIIYALSDVTHLVRIYEKLKNQISDGNRSLWIEDEMKSLAETKNYKLNPSEAWMKIKIKSTKREYLNRVKFLAEWRENVSIKSNVPKNRIMRDDTLLDLASINPKSNEDFKRIRYFNIERDVEKINQISEILNKAQGVPERLWPENKNIKKNKVKSLAILELLKVLIKHVCEEQKVAQKLIAKQDELELIAEGKFDRLKVLDGWRYKIFGKLALELIEGKVSLKIKNKKIFILHED
ncbi:MAG: ribonuclease D [Candidatus Puniceispirillales bacterium]